MNLFLEQMRLPAKNPLGVLFVAGSGNSNQKEILMKTMSKRRFEIIEARIEKWDNKHDDKEIFMLAYGAAAGDLRKKDQLISTLKKMKISIADFLRYCEANSVKIIQAYEHDIIIVIEEKDFLKKIRKCLK